ncbi:MAG: hypothetical protein GX249_07215 [Firmicutes bacterium]|nr:hypothetical protein [Bacillota bacterium]
MRTVIAAILIVSLLVAGSGLVFASDRAEIPVTVKIPQMIMMKLDATELVFNEVDFDYLLGDAHLTKVGVVATRKRAVTATISGNVPYTLFVSAPEEYLIGARGGTIHISQLRWRLTDRSEEDDWESISLERVQVRGGPPGTMEVVFDFQLTAYWENPAQVYGGQILLTVIPEGV